ncbi:MULTISPECIES: hypothetical protein [unclassified Chryseobacterium]|uniref:hypothetical protein n=1 Tax=unclassified Chryseobacterium TaxID=2593645 RepID=UPI000D3D5534|nr:MULTISPECIES: hypothetical protein [unclassified Chryseobacterium]MCQ4142758.1 hypothetical protein [Chryseobacterium sp. EO14]PTT75247.1 hypothetical protein DBR25_08815 [Chryseobacterium sp. HMWF001]PVV50771.1 hypothetical protein DD829_21445 [Chryseobacterium sp. HMWF035]
MKLNLPAFLSERFSKTSVSFPLSLSIYLYTRNRYGETIHHTLYEKWFSKFTSCFTATFGSYLTETIKQYCFTEHQQMIEISVDIITILDTNSYITTEEIEHILLCLLDFGWETDQANICYELNGIMYHLPV